MPARPALDPYAVLGVPRDATPLQVARAHRRLAKKLHPDLHPGADGAERAAQMRRVNQAWQILSSGLRRADYDVAHPSAGTGRSGHWAASRQPVRAAQPSTTRTWASWRASADETITAPRTRRQPGEIQAPATRRPTPIARAQPSFRDSGWAALLAAVAFLVILAAAIVAGRIV